MILQKKVSFLDLTTYIDKKTNDLTQRKNRGANIEEDKLSHTEESIIKEKPKNDEEDKRKEEGNYKDY